MASAEAEDSVEASGRKDNQFCVARRIGDVREPPRGGVLAPGNGGLVQEKGLDQYEEFRTLNIRMAAEAKGIR